MLRILSIFLIAACALSCTNTERPVARGFYYWKTTFDPTPKEQELLRAHTVQTLFVRLFDVGVNAAGEPVPQGKLEWRQRPSAVYRITPVVFITQEALRRCDSTGIDSLAARIGRLAAAQCAGLRLSGGFQADCDWSAGTRDRYFRLLRQLRRQPFLQNKKLSVTIRLHQLRYIAQNGIPPAERGLLMAYNMGNLKDARTRNSIVDLNELEKYTAGLPSYPLPLDVALPVFDWWVLFDGNRYEGLVYLRDPALFQKDRLGFARDTMLGGYRFRAGQWLRHERSDATEVDAVARHLATRLRSDSIGVVLFHLDEGNLAGYSSHDLENLYGVFGHRRARAFPR
ncbi:hypothetical protein EPD60_10175 [Flaviaesturariibacter flavus]|uniref:Uncharacterized protein n=1 Tax=Flaviaesturariibacter flavus TaxID=2502780 RepID=A0A4R1BBG5_9BACT|nr:hypothetical protein [Flaviaesturariibacter flavus]TCJ14355.1 hypothetical protein EPD60_10175 [Flaviaesturariibacter flavus]